MCVSAAFYWTPPQLSRCIYPGWRPEGRSRGGACLALATSCLPFCRRGAQERPTARARAGAGATRRGPPCAEAQDAACRARPHPADAAHTRGRGVFPRPTCATETWTTPGKVPPTHAQGVDRDQVGQQPGCATRAHRSTTTSTSTTKGTPPTSAPSRAQDAELQLRREGVAALCRLLRGQAPPRRRPLFGKASRSRVRVPANLTPLHAFGLTPARARSPPCACAPLEVASALYAEAEPPRAAPARARSPRARAAGGRRSEPPSCVLGLSPSPQWNGTAFS